MPRHRTCDLHKLPCHHAPTFLGLLGILPQTHTCPSSRGAPPGSQSHRRIHSLLYLVGSCQDPIHTRALDPMDQCTQCHDSGLEDTALSAHESYSTTVQYIETRLEAFKYRNRSLVTNLRSSELCMFSLYTHIRTIPPRSLIVHAAASHYSRTSGQLTSGHFQFMKRL